MTEDLAHCYEQMYAIRQRQGRELVQSGISEAVFQNVSTRSPHLGPKFREALPFVSVYTDSLNKWVEIELRTQVDQHSYDYVTDIVAAQHGDTAKPLETYQDLPYMLAVEFADELQQAASEATWPINERSFDPKYVITRNYCGSLETGDNGCSVGLE